MHKFLFILISIVFFGCKDDSQKIENIEIMSYDYIPNYNLKKYEVSTLFYAKLDFDGNVQIMKLMKPLTENYLFFETKIDNNIIEKISKNNLNKNEEFYNNPNRKTDPDIYCGPIKRVKLKYKNDRQFSFAYTSEIGKDLNDFVNLFKILENFSKSIIQETEEIRNQQKQFLKFAMMKDTTMLSLPPFPKLKIDEVKFVKPH